MGAKRVRGRVVLAAIWLGVCSGAAVGREAIVGGSPAAGSSWPFIVALIDPTAPSVEQGQYCSGVLVDPSWVLTTSSCIYDENGNQIAPNQVDVLAGVTDLRAPDAGQRRAVASIVDHPLASAAVLRLASPIDSQASPPIAPIDIVNELESSLWTPGSPVQVAGWGSTTPADPPAWSPVLLDAGLTRVADATCTATLSGFDPTIDLCSDSPALGADPCVGDDGGPLTATDPTGRRVLVGLVSFGPTPCGAGPTGFTRLTPIVRDWVSDLLGRVRPGRVEQLQATVPNAPYTATLTWTPPAPGTEPLLGYTATVLDGASSRTLVLPVATMATISDLRPAASGTTINVTLSAVSRAGIGQSAVLTIEPLRVASFNPGPTLGRGPPQIGQMFTVKSGTLVSPSGTRIRQVVATASWETCTAASVACSPMPSFGGLSVPVTAAAVGRRIRATVSAGARGYVNATATTPLSDVVPPSISGTLLEKPKRGDRVRIRARVKTHVGSELIVYLSDHKGKKIPLDRLQSTIEGRRPKLLPGGRRLRAVVRKGAPPVLTIVTAGRRIGPLRNGTLTVSASINGSIRNFVHIPVKIPALPS